jgi:hypothetical protein
MRFIRKKFVLRSFSVFCAVAILNSIVFPIKGYALTTGPHQPEFASYEEAHSPDMVNLPTGDFTYNTNLLTVPTGPDSGFPLPIFYHAGIGPDQEASWVGLGFNINVGSLTRDINGFPDDANNDPRDVQVQQLNIDHGWKSSFLGSEIGWDANEGHYGIIELGIEKGGIRFGWGKENQGLFQIAFLTIKDGKVQKFDWKNFMITVAEIALAVLTEGGSEVAAEGEEATEVAAGTGLGAKELAEGVPEILEATDAAKELPLVGKMIKEATLSGAKAIINGQDNEGILKDIAKSVISTYAEDLDVGEPGEGSFLKKMGDEYLDELTPLLTKDGKLSAAKTTEVQMDLIDELMESPEAPEVGGEGYWEPTTHTHQKLFRTEYTVNIEVDRTENMFGVLHLERAPIEPATTVPGFLVDTRHINGVPQPMNQFALSDPVNNKGAASDINIDVSGDEYWDNTNPALLAYDNYNVKGPGVSGTIKPYRLEVGSVAVPREMTTGHTRLNPTPFVGYAGLKVPFVYEGAKGNSYYNHVGSAGATVSAPNFYDNSFNSQMLVDNGLRVLEYDITDGVFDDATRIKNNSVLGEPVINTTKRIPQAHHIEWLNNADVAGTGSFLHDYMDYFRPADRSSFRGQLQTGHQVVYTANDAFSFSGTVTFPDNVGYGDEFRTGETVSVHLVVVDQTGPTVISDNTYTGCTIQTHVPNVVNVTGSFPSITQIPNRVIHIELISDGHGHRNNNIGGFVITDPSGNNYHYALPVYDDTFLTTTKDKNDPSKYTTIKRDLSFANTWLLTAITGPDFIDRSASGGAADGFVDDNDFGYWVKFNYGYAGNSFGWATPFNKSKVSSDEQAITWAQGKKEKYYLNSIESRSHVAIFIKDSRDDSKDSEGVTQANTMRLSEVHLITKDAYNQLNATYSLADLSGKVSDLYRPAFFGGTSGAAYNFLRKNAIKALIFHQDYSLCRGLPTSVNGGGKLTLNSITMCKFDPNTYAQVKIMPDYKFAYDAPYYYNPSYNADMWDGWGMFASGGQPNSGTTHKVNQSSTNTDGLEWQLTKVTTPEGCELQVGYERDTYQYISGRPLPATDFTMSGTYGVTFSQADVSKFITNSPGSLKAGDWINVAGNLTANCSGTPITVDFNTISPGQSVLKQVLSVSGSEVTLTSPLGTVHCSTSINVTVTGGWSPMQKKGGDTRVSSIVLNDPAGHAFKSQYQYNYGTVAVEPDYVRTSELDFYNYLGYPSTPVMYGEVTVLVGKLTNSNDWHTKQVYAFETPNENMYSWVPSVHKNQQQAATSGGLTDYSTTIDHKISIHTAKIGKINSVNTYEAGNVNPVSTKTYTYTESPTNTSANNWQGLFSEGTMLFEAMQKDNNNRYHRAQRTTSLTYPYMPLSVVTTKDGFSKVESNIDWDFQTGAVLTNRTALPSGLVTETVQIPAYKIFGAMDSKVMNSSNRNMVSQRAVKMVFRLDASNARTGLIDAKAVTYKSDWANYRVWDNAQQKFVNSADPSLPAIIRANQEFTYKGIASSLNPDGTHVFNLSTDGFNFTHVPNNQTTIGDNPKWKNTSTVKRYDHYSEPLENMGITGIHSAKKMGYLDKLMIADARNAHFEEIAFSGAEDDIITVGTPPVTFFGGEVQLFDGTVVTTPVHTGTKALSVAANGHGFTFKTDKLFNTKAYKASVWCNSNTGRIYYKINGGTEVVNTPTAITQIGSWYKLDYVFPPVSASPGTYAFEVGVKAASGAAIFDDFRFQPLVSDMTTYVYDPVTRDVTFSLNNDNLYTQFEYDSRGVQTKTYLESGRFNGGRLASETKQDYRRFHTNQ